MKARTCAFAVGVMLLVDELPKKACSRAVGLQLARCATSVGANYHIACTARSKSEFLAKVGIVLEESDECLYWLLIVDAKPMPEKRLGALINEANELTAIFTSSIKTAKGLKRNDEC